MDIVRASPSQLASLISNPRAALSPERAAQAFGRIARLWSLQLRDGERGLLQQALGTLAKQSEEVAGRMSARQIAQAVVCISKCRGGGRGGGGGDRGAVPLLETLEARALDVIPMFKPQGLSNMMRAFASMRRKPGPRLLRALLQSATASAASFTPHDTSILLGALASLALPPDPPLHHALAESLENQAGQANAQDVANALWAYATLRLPLSPGLSSALDRRATDIAASFSPQDLSQALWAAASLDTPPSRVLFGRLKKRALEVAPLLKPREVANIRWSLATMHIAAGPRLGAALNGRCLAIMEELNPQDVANLTWALAKCRQPPPPLLVSRLAHRARSTARDFSPREVAMAMWGFATMTTNLARCVWGVGPTLEAGCADADGRPLEGALVAGGDEVARTAAEVLGVRVEAAVPPAAVLLPCEVSALAGSLGSAARARIHEFQPRELSNLLWAFATLAENPGEALLGAIKQQAVRAIHGFKPQELSNLLSALATMGQPPGEELGGAVRSRALDTIGSFNPRDVSSILWAFATLGESPGPRLLSALRLRAVEQMSLFDAQSTANTLWAFAALGKTPRGEVLAALCGRAVALLTREEEAGRGEGGDPMGRLRQVHQFILSCELEGLHEGALQEPCVLAVRDALGPACRAAFGRSSTESALQRQVAAALLELGLECEGEAVDPASGYSIDVLVRMRDGPESVGIAVEVDGPAHFLAGPRARARGSTLLKRRQLRLLGYRVVSVPYWQWDRLKGEGSRAAYLKGLLGLGGKPGGEGDGKGASY